MGHLYNLTAYYHHQQYRQSLEEVSLADMAESNFKALKNKLDTLDIKQKRVKSEIEWLKSKSRKEKIKKIKENSFQPQ